MLRRLAPAILILTVLTTGTAQAHDGIDRLTNEFRVNHDRYRLRSNANLTDLAHLRARQIVTSFGHSFYWLNFTRCETGGENLAYRKPALDKGKARWFVEAWKDSPPHRRVMLTRSWRRMGSAIHLEAGAMWGVQLFCDPR